MIAHSELHGLILISMLVTTAGDFMKKGSTTLIHLYLLPKVKWFYFLQTAD